MYLSSISSRLLLYDINSWDLKKSYGCYDSVLRDISWSDDSKYILQVNSKGSVEVLSPIDHDIRSLQHIPIKDSWSASFHREGHGLVAIGTRNGEVMIWDTKNKAITKTFPTPPQTAPVNFISYNAKNTSLAATMQNGDTIIYGLVSNIPVLTVKLLYSKSISAMKFHHECRSLLGLATDEGHVVLRDVITNKDKVFFENIHASPVGDFSFSLINKDVMFSCGYDKIMHVYDIRLQNVVSTIKTSFALTSLAINAENLVALGTKSGHVLVYDLRNVTTPYKVLKEHEEEVRKVAFQPSRRKMFLTDLSLNERTESPVKLHSPVRNRSSDLFLANHTPPKINLDTSTDIKTESFLVNLGLDKSNFDIDDEANGSTDYPRKSDKSELRYRQLDSEKNISKTSTPLVNRNFDVAFSTPLVLPNGYDEARTVNVPNNQENAPNVVFDSNVVDELKDFMKLSLFDVAYDNKNYFLHIMMALTKQKLYLEKQMERMSNQIENLVENQNVLIEANRQLILQIDQLKSNNSY